MLTNQNSNNKRYQVITGNSNVGYYKNKLRKFLDFLIGSVGSVVLLAIDLFAITNTLFNRISIAVDNPNSYYSIIFIMVILLILSIIFVRIGRKFITVGIASAFLIPLLVVGSFMFLISGFGG